MLVKKPAPQTPKTKNLSRADHVWAEAPLTSRHLYRCCLCGAATDDPPPCPTPDDWMPEAYEPLTPVERALCPYKP